jgi:hypothetical protein
VAGVEIQQSNVSADERSPSVAVNTPSSTAFASSTKRAAAIRLCCPSRFAGRSDDAPTANQPRPMSHFVSSIRPSPICMRRLSA